MADLSDESYYALFVDGVVASLPRLGPALRAWLGGLLLLAIIPFGQATPSYNTIGLQALCVAPRPTDAPKTSPAAVCLMRGLPCRLWPGWSPLSPTLSGPRGLLIAVLLVLLRHGRRLATRRYLAMLLTSRAVVWTVVIGFLSVSRLLKSVQNAAGMAHPGWSPCQAGTRR